jgi:tyrosyl-tRNA synthetase
MLNNSDWLSSFNYIDFLREFGKEFTVNRMLSFDSVKLRLERENPLTFLEFNYMILQAVDFLHLYKNHGVTLQMGGSDQWGNIINGVELVRRCLHKEVFGLTTHLITKSDGSKMGKTAGGAVWLSEDMFSTWDFYQYFRNVDDFDVIKYLKNFTEVPIADINKLSQLKGKELNEAKKLLAFEITKLCHGESEAIKCQELAINTFEKNTLDDNLPTFYVKEVNLIEGVSLVNSMVSFGLSASNSESRRLIQNSGVKINSQTCSDMNYKITSADFKENGSVLISLGKKKHILVKIGEQ